MLETGIGRIQNILLQAKEEFTIPGDTSGSNRYYSPDIITPEVIVDQDGFIEVPSDNNAFQVNVDMLNKISNQILTYKL
jgi:O-succinylbenzoate synthase